MLRYLFLPLCGE